MELKNSYMQNYFYLNDKLFAFLNKDNNIYVVDISKENKIVRKIESICNEKGYFIKDILYMEKEDKDENLYILFANKGRKIVLKDNKLTDEEKEGKIIHGIIEKKKDE